ncbi:MAG: type VI secretion system baseplate subunit TssK [Chlamydiales bacterium]
MQKSMQQLKRVAWQIGQPLLPIHLIMQEEALLAHLSFYIQNIGIPFYGIGHLKWDETLLSQGVVSISKLIVIFPTGEVIDVPENGKISSFDLNIAGLNQVSLYLHLLKDLSLQDAPNDSFEEEEKVVYFIHNLAISNEAHLFAGKVSLKLGEFEKDVENRWKLSEHYSPPLFTICNHPFLIAKLSTIRTILESFQKELGLESTTGKLFEQRTLNTKLCLREIANFKQFLLNMDRNIITHPYYLYNQLTQFVNTLALIYLDLGDFNILPYQHEKLASLFSKLIEQLIQYLKPKSERLSSISFEKRQNCYVSEKLSRDLFEANEIYFIAQFVDPKTKFSIEGLKLAAYSRLYNVRRFALTGIVLLRLESAPFNNNFSKHAYVYKIEKDSEWEHALSEEKLAFSIEGDMLDMQGFIYWR